ncbi:response regulator transcription factor [Deinococcus roseus]|uniref:Response regulatory domain-containing protein n=1 Tax=Deinococcus roseus TaxID=392414 RepID=A0ABQ2DDS0_9DEIO|nr:response regulator transcription factor [Deinococcus roseus]GGJ54629.1 hypothetical protein GCM10008938_45890 [Deinococcus roseus]
MKNIVLLGDLSVNALRMQLYFEDHNMAVMLCTQTDALEGFPVPDALIVEVQDRLRLKEWLPALRSSWDIPILLLASRLDRTKTAQLLDLGADDCVYKPADPAEVHAHLQALWRRYPLSLQHRQPTEML